MTQILSGTAMKTTHRKQTRRPSPSKPNRSLNRLRNRQSVNPRRDRDNGKITLGRSFSRSAAPTATHGDTQAAPNPKPESADTTNADAPIPSDYQGLIREHIRGFTISFPGQTTAP